jgi:hypothetical protein
MKGMMSPGMLFLAITIDYRTDHMQHEAGDMEYGIRIRKNTGNF